MYYILHGSKQCKVNTFCKKLVEGSAPKPLRTRACALWLWGYVYDCMLAGISVIPRFGTCTLISCIVSTEWLWDVLQIIASLQLL